ncbi:hypothetical protein [Agrococcus baldri]|uniref:Uncharacterized protein n=1 Tax=Agrococcus baldri TaxID=153730 RepID=A0AA87UX67_9MICO|nr:hypothetical protein [Agrococcus baldri]GEK80087.1 hypothetical protein ABA31_14380 [Agrococcus baldri]
MEAASEWTGHKLAIDLRKFRDPLHSIAEIDPKPIEELTLFVARNSDLSGLEEFKNLESLYIDRRVDVPEDAVFPKLERYDGPFAAPILRSPNLRELLCTEARTAMHADLEIVGPLERLLAYGNRKDGALPRPAQPEMLRDFDVAFFDSLDLDGLAQCRILSELRFGSVKRIDHVDQITELPAIRLLSFDDVLHLAPSASLDGLIAETGIGISGRHGFSPAARARLSALDHGWGFPPNRSERRTPLHHYRGLDPTEQNSGQPFAFPRCHDATTNPSTRERGPRGRLGNRTF